MVIGCVMNVICVVGEYFVKGVWRRGVKGRFRSLVWRVIRGVFLKKF